MDKKYLNKIFIIIVLLVVVVGLYIIRKKDSTGNGNYYDESNSKNVKIVKLWIGVNDMRDKLGELNIYPDYYLQVKTGEIIGKTKKQSIKETENAIIEKEALYRNALSKGSRLSKKEVNRGLKKMLKEMKLDKDNKLKRIYKSQNTTLEKEFKRNKRWYIYDMTLRKWEDNFLLNADKNKLKSETRKVIKAFKKTAKYKKIKKAFNFCREALSKYGNDVIKIKQVYGNKLNVYLRI